MGQTVDEGFELERRELDELQRHPGWRRFLQMVDEAYSPAAQVVRIKKQIDGLPPADGPGQGATAREVIACAGAVQAAVMWPRERIKKLDTIAPVVPLVPRRA